MERYSSFLSWNQGSLFVGTLYMMIYCDGGGGGDPGICYEDMSEECEPGGVS